MKSATIQEKKCVYLRCFGIQFSFHNINVNYIDQKIVDLISKEPAVWDGIKLQPVAPEIYRLAKDCQVRDISDTNIIMARFQHIKN